MACLRLADAEQVRERLLAMARPPGQPTAAAPAGPPPVAGAPGPPGAVGGPGRVLFRVDPGRLAGAIALSRAGALAAIVLAMMAVAAGKRVTAGIEDRGAAEAEDILASLPDLARDARAARRLCSDRGPEDWPRKLRSAVGRGAGGVP